MRPDKTTQRWPLKIAGRLSGMPQRSLRTMLSRGVLRILPPLDAIRASTVLCNHGQKFRQKILHQPRIENVGGDIGDEQAYGQQRLSDQGVDHIGSASFMPVFYAMGAFTHWRIAMRAGHVVRKAAFIKINDNAAFLLIAFNFLLKDTSLFFAGFWVKQAFFYK
jgi:hypothetical protein